MADTDRDLASVHTASLKTCCKRDYPRYIKGKTWTGSERELLEKFKGKKNELSATEERSRGQRTEVYGYCQMSVRPARLSAIRDWSFD